MCVVSPGTPFNEDRLRVLDYTAYYRFIQKRLEASIAARRAAPDQTAPYPDPVPLCDVCRWWSACNKRRHDDDHPCLVAGISSLQRDELTVRGVATLAGLARITLPLTPRPRRGSEEGYAEGWRKDERSAESRSWQNSETVAEISSLPRSHEISNYPPPASRRAGAPYHAAMTIKNRAGRRQFCAGNASENTLPHARYKDQNRFVFGSVRIWSSASRRSGSPLRAIAPRRRTRP